MVIPDLVADFVPPLLPIVTPFLAILDPVGTVVDDGAVSHARPVTNSGAITDARTITDFRTITSTRTVGDAGTLTRTRAVTCTGTVTGRQCSRAGARVTKELGGCSAGDACTDCRTNVATAPTGGANVQKVL